MEIKENHGCGTRARGFVSWVRSSSPTSACAPPRVVAVLVVAVILGDFRTPRVMAEQEWLWVDSVTKLSESFQRLETLVEGLASEKCSSGYGAASDIDSAGRRHVDREGEPTPSAAVSSCELQSEFRAIKESVANVKLPADLIVGTALPASAGLTCPSSTCSKNQQDFKKLR